MLSDLKDPSDQEDGDYSDNKFVGNFLQNLKASKQTGLLHAEEPQMDDQLSDFGAGKSAVDSILDSGNFCNDDASAYQDLHSRNPSGVPMD